MLRYAVRSTSRRHVYSSLYPLSLVSCERFKSSHPHSEPENDGDPSFSEGESATYGMRGTENDNNEMKEKEQKDPAYRVSTWRPRLEQIRSKPKNPFMPRTSKEIQKSPSPPSASTSSSSTAHWRSRLSSTANDEDLVDKTNPSELMSTFVKPGSSTFPAWRASSRISLTNIRDRPMKSSTTAQTSTSMWMERTKAKQSDDYRTTTLGESGKHIITDMTDVSKLRAAMIKSAQIRKENQEKGLDESPVWRQKGGGAREFRKRMKEQEHQGRRQQQRPEQGKYQPRVPSDPSSFLASAKDEWEERQKRKEEQMLQRQRQSDGGQVVLPHTPVSVLAISRLLRVKVDDLLKSLRALGEKALDEEYVIDIDTIELLALDLGLKPVRSSRRVTKSVEEESRELLLQRRALDDEVPGDSLESESRTLRPRPPVVCIMGHVDHGKTTLMDALRRRSNKLGAKGDGQKKKKQKNKGSGTNVKSALGDVAGTEAGGITQVISAFQVPLDDGSGDNKSVTFLDTPGHAAFRSMRESGSHAADVIVLVIAADDGVSRQTVEILDFYKSIISEAGEGGISLMVAMTKIDKPGISVDESRYRIESELLDHGIITESFAGTTDSKFGPPVQLVPVSGITGDGLDELIESLVLQSEVMELRADQNARAEGIIMDARVEKGIGVVVDCIVRWGSMERGDIVLSGIHMGKVKALKDVGGSMVKRAIPSQPIRIIGFSSLPKAGDPVICVDSEEKAELLVERRLALGGGMNTVRSEADIPFSLEVTGIAAQQATALRRIHEKYDIAMEQEGSTIRIPVVIKADADGTLAALRESLVKIGEESSLDFIVDPIGQGIGPVSVNDVHMARDSNAAIFTFNVKNNDKEAIAMAETEDVPIKSNNVIYTLLDDAKEVFVAYLPRARVERVHGKAVVQAVFNINNGADRIAGLRVLEGSLFRTKAPLYDGGEVVCQYRVMRGQEQVSPKGDMVKASSLKKVKEDVQDVRNGEECGLALDGFKDFEEGDVIECYSVSETKAIL